MKKERNTYSFRLLQRGVWLSVFTILLFSCADSNKQNDNSDKPLNETNMEIEKKELTNKVQAASDKAEKQIKMLENKLSQASDDAKEELEKTVDLLKLEQEKLAAKAKEASAATEQDWIKFKSEADDALEKANSTIDSLVNNVKSSLN